MSRVGLASPAIGNIRAQHPYWFKKEYFLGSQRLIRNWQEYPTLIEFKPSNSVQLECLQMADSCCSKPLEEGLLRLVITLSMEIEV